MTTSPANKPTVLYVVLTNAQFQRTLGSSAHPSSSTIVDLPAPLCLSSRRSLIHQLENVFPASGESSEPESSEESMIWVLALPLTSQLLDKIEWTAGEAEEGRATLKQGETIDWVHDVAVRRPVKYDQEKREWDVGELED